MAEKIQAKLESTFKRDFGLGSSGGNGEGSDSGGFEEEVLVVLMVVGFKKR